MKIGFFTDGYLPQINGVATSTAQLAKSLRGIKNRVKVVAPKHPHFKDKDKNVLRLKSIKIYNNPEIRFSYMFPDKILRQVITEDFDIIHGFSGGSIPSLGLALSKIKRKPYVFTYNTRWNQYTHYILNGKVVTKNAVEKATAMYCNRCDAIVAPADFVREELLSFGIKKPIVVIPNGVDIKTFSKGKKGYLRKNFGIKEDKIALYLGRISKEKSVDFVIKAFKIASESTNDCHLAIGGDGAERGKLEKLVKRLGLTQKVTFLGFVNFKDVPKVYNDSDVFVFASETETQGMVILEAMASSLPVLVTKDRVFEQVIENEKDGIMVDRNQKEFAHVLKKLLTNDELRKTIGQNARKKAETFSLEEIAKKFDTLYKSLI